jgi:hypothetical protein
MDRDPFRVGFDTEQKFLASVYRDGTIGDGKEHQYPSRTSVNYSGGDLSLSTQAKLPNDVSANVSLNAHGKVTPGFTFNFGGLLYDMTFKSGLGFKFNLPATLMMMLPRLMKGNFVDNMKLILKGYLDIIRHPLKFIRDMIQFPKNVWKLFAGIISSIRHSKPVQYVAHALKPILKPVEKAVKAITKPISKLLKKIF